MTTVNYLTHNWRDYDLLRSWRDVMHKNLTNTTFDGLRLENASWRLWQKLAWTDNLKETVGKQTVSSWLGHSDTLYGPLHAAIDWEAPSHRQLKVRLITGHAFIGSYAARFLPGKPISCPCGEPLQTVDHVVSHCPLYTDARQEILRPIDRDISLPVLLGTAEGGAAMTRFLKATRACIAPREAWNPG
ncbi:hypothetical protein BGW80DRAFT_1527032 [Lactifluus volemus]|nr:hypothetical protein BGW80DRAFT_1527032 [Lactifluus volemus]